MLYFLKLVTSPSLSYLCNKVFLSYNCKLYCKLLRIFYSQTVSVRCSLVKLFVIIFKIRTTREEFNAFFFFFFLDWERTFLLLCSLSFLCSPQPVTEHQPSTTKLTNYSQIRRHAHFYRRLASWLVYSLIKGSWMKFSQGTLTPKFSKVAPGELDN